MCQIKHTISGVTFYIESDVELKPLKNNWFEKFTAEDAQADVHYKFCKIEQGDLVLPALDPDERKRILQCNIQTRLNPGGFILPPFAGISGWNFLENIDIKSPLDVPLLCSLKVRERINSCTEYPNEITLILHAYSVAIFDYRLNRFDLFYRSDQQWVFENIPLENGFRRMFSSFLPSFSAAMLHSSGVVRENRAALFLASDEGGKSTVLKNLTNGTRLNDDRNIIRMVDGELTVYSTPWGQNNDGPNQANLGGLFLIEKAQEFGLFPIKPSEMIEFLWNEHIQFWQILPKVLRVKAFELVADICYQIPCYKMCFPKNFVDWGAIDKVLQGNPN